MATKGTGEIVRRHYRVEGTVQGVGFRWWTARAARQAGLAGMVRNEPDGTVDVEVAGEREAVERFRVALADGPPSSRVDRVDELSPSDRVLPDPFEIRH